MFDRIMDIGRSAVDAVSGFFKSDTFDVARNIYDGVKTVTDAISGTMSKMDQSPPRGLADPNVNLGQYKIPGGTSRSRAGVSSFSDVQEESYYKYAQAQNLVRYLYGAKARYKNMIKGKS